MFVVKGRICLFAMMFLSSLLCAQQPGQDPTLANPTWPEAGFHYSKLFTEGPSSNHYKKLGDLFFQESYPKHAIFYYELAASLDPDNSELKDAWKKAQDRLAYLEKRFHDFSQKAAEDSDPSYYGRISAIRFHLGDRRESLKILNNALQTFNNDRRLSPLVGAFQKQLQYETFAAQALVEEFQKALDEKKLDQAMNYLGQINFLSLGHIQVIRLLEMAEKTFPKGINEESALLLTEFSRQFNQIDLKDRN